MGVNNPNTRPKIKVKPVQPPKPEVSVQAKPQTRKSVKPQTQQAVKVALQTAKNISSQRLKPVKSKGILGTALSDVSKGARAVVKETEKLGQKQDAMRRAQPQGLADAAKQFVAIHQHAGVQEAGMGGTRQFVGALGKVAAATAVHPIPVAKATLKSVPGAVEGLVAGPAELIANPGKTLKGISKDYAYRYGKDAGKAVQQTGLLPYGLDAAAAAVPVGRAAGFAAKEGALGKVGETVMADRPKLRVSPSTAVKQDKSPNLFKAVGQTLQDTKREKATLKRQNAGTPRGIEPQGPNEVVPVSKRAANKKLEQSFGVRSGMNRNLHAQARQELRTFFEKHVPKTLTKDQINRGAFRYAVEHGIRTPEQAATYLPKLKSLIQENRTKTPLNDELPHIQWLIDHPQVFDPNLASVADQATELGSRLGAEDPRLKPKQQLQRTVTPQSLLLGEGERVPIKKGQTGGERVKTFAKRVDAARQEAGLAKPGYFPHRDLLTPKFADYVRGTGIHGAVGGHKETSYTLLKEGAAVVHPQALSDALARNLKNQFNVNHVADTVASFHVRKLTNLKTGEPIHLDPTKSNYHDLEKAKEDSGVKDLVPYRPNTIYKAMRDENKNPDGRTFLSDAYTMAKDPSQFHNSKGWVLIPKEIDRQMRDSLKHNSAGSRFLAKNKAFNTKVILGLNPSWPMMRVGHNLGSSAVFNVNPLKGIEAAKNLSPEQLKQLNVQVGSDAFHFDRTPPRLGASVAPDSKVAALRDIALSNTKTGKAIRAANPATWVDQLSRPAMAAERHQMSFFRRAAAYQKLTKDAKTKVGRDVNGFVHTVSQARDELLKDPQYMEQLAHHVNEIYGDFSHYQGLQRSLQQNVMFYGFLRYATRVVLKDLPTKHPIKANILLNLSRQNERNTRDILGLGPNDPLPFGADANVYSRGKDGLAVQNFHRLNPFGAVSLESLDNPRKMATSEIPFLQKELLSQGLNADLLRMHGLRVDGKAAEKGIGDHISPLDRLRIAVADFSKQVAPYRVADNTVARGRTMGNDSLAFSPRPVVHKQTQAIANDLLKEKFGREQGFLGQLTKAELPFVKQPTRDNMLALQVKQIEEQLAGKHLTPQQKAAEETKILSQPGYAAAFAKAQVLSKQRSKHRSTSSGNPFDSQAHPGKSNPFDSQAHPAAQNPFN